MSNTTSSSNGNEVVIDFKVDTTQVQIQVTETLIKTLQLKVKMTQVEINANKAKIRILKESLNDTGAS